MIAHYNGGDRFIPNLYAEESPVARMLDLIARKAPLLMRAGGGALSRDMSANWHAPHALTLIKRRRAIELGREGRYTATQIAEMVGATQASVFKALKRAGITPPDGRSRQFRAQRRAQR